MAVNTVLEALDDDDPRCTLHKHAVGHVAERGVMDVVSPLIEEFVDKLKEIRHAALEALAKVSAASIFLLPARPSPT